MCVYAHAYIYIYIYIICIQYIIYNIDTFVVEQLTFVVDLILWVEGLYVFNLYQQKAYLF